MEQVKLSEFPRDGRYDYTRSINCPRVMNCNGAVDGYDLMAFISGVKYQSWKSLATREKIANK